MDHKDHEGTSKALPARGSFEFICSAENCLSGRSLQCVCRKTECNGWNVPESCEAVAPFACLDLQWTTVFT